MKTLTATVLRREFKLPFPETMEEVEALVPDEGDRLELIRFALHHRMRSMIGQMGYSVPKTKVQEVIDSYRYRRNFVNNNKRRVR